MHRDHKESKDRDDERRDVSLYVSSRNRPLSGVSARTRMTRASPAGEHEEASRRARSPAAFF
jgi:hypothetical protein